MPPGPRQPGQSPAAAPAANSNNAARLRMACLPLHPGLPLSIYPRTQSPATSRRATLAFPARTRGSSPCSEFTSSPSCSSRSLRLFAEESPVIARMDATRFTRPRTRRRWKWSRARSARRSVSASRRTPAARSSPATSAARPPGTRRRASRSGSRATAPTRFGGLQFIYDDDYAVRYDFCFPDQGQGVDEGDGRLARPRPGAARPEGEAAGRGRRQPAVEGHRRCGSASGGTGATTRPTPSPSTRSAWSRRSSATPRTTTPDGDPLARVLAKLKAGKPVTDRHHGRLADRHPPLGQPRG